jgi:hypothetical protein
MPEAEATFAGAARSARPPRRLRGGTRLTSRRRRRLFADRAARARYAPRLVAGIEHELWRLGGAEVVIDRALGRALGRLKEGLRYRRLGFELWRDYVRERVGVEPRWAQYLMALDRGLITARRSRKVWA